jgi:hypothetical protein
VSRLTLSHLIEEVVAPHRLMGVPIAIRIGPAEDDASRGAARPEPVTERNPGVLYGLGNIVENAVDFAASSVDVEARFVRGEIAIADDGTGFPPNARAVGEPSHYAARQWTDVQHMSPALDFSSSRRFSNVQRASVCQLPERRSGHGRSRAKFEQARIGRRRRGWLLRLTGGRWVAVPR